MSKNGRSNIPQQVAKIPLAQAIQTPAIVIPNSKGFNPKYPVMDPDRFSSQTIKIVNYPSVIVPFEK